MLKPIATNPNVLRPAFQAGEVYDGATLRTSDLIFGFLDWMQSYAPEEYEAFKAERTKAGDSRYFLLSEGMREIPETEGAEYFLNETLFDYMQEIAPPYTYFGSHEGNGSCFGFWPNIEPEHCEDVVLPYGDAPKFAYDGSDYETPGDADIDDIIRDSILSPLVTDSNPNPGVLRYDVNDHGNASLYWVDMLDVTEVWAFV